MSGAFQLTSVVRSCVVPSLKVPVAVYCSVASWLIDVLSGLIAREDKAMTVKVVESLNPR
jgi:hypothetical protein